jgi:hypothetical protein
MKQRVGLRRGSAALAALHSFGARVPTLSVLLLLPPLLSVLLLLLPLLSVLLLLLPRSNRTVNRLDVVANISCSGTGYIHADVELRSGAIASNGQRR